MRCDPITDDKCQKVCPTDDPEPPECVDCGNHEKKCTKKVWDANNCKDGKASYKKVTICIPEDQECEDDPEPDCKCDTKTEQECTKKVWNSSTCTSTDEVQCRPKGELCPTDDPEPNECKCDLTTQKECKRTIWNSTTCKKSTEKKCKPKDELCPTDDPEPNKCKTKTCEYITWE